MANVKISELPSATTPLNGTEEVPIVQNGETVKVATNQIGIGKVANILATPGIITADFSTAPLASTVAIGTIWIDNATNYFIYQSNGSSWLQIGGGGNIPNLQDVLNQGNTAYNVGIILYDNINNNAVVEINGFYSIADISSPFNNSVLTFDSLQITNSVTQRNVVVNTDYIAYTNISGIPVNQYIYPNSTYANQKAYIPESNGTLALQDPPLDVSINTTPFTPSGNYNKIYRVVTGASNIILNPASWTDRKTLIFLVDITGTSFSTTGGATIRGAVGGVYAISVGMVSVMYLQTNNTFYISRT